MYSCHFAESAEQVCQTTSLYAGSSRRHAPLMGSLIAGITLTRVDLPAARIQMSFGAPLQAAIAVA